MSGAVDNYHRPSYPQARSKITQMWYSQFTHLVGFIVLAVLVHELVEVPTLLLHVVVVRREGDLRPLLEVVVIVEIVLILENQKLCHRKRKNSMTPPRRNKEIKEAIP